MDLIVLEQVGADATIIVTLSPGDTDDVLTFVSQNPAIATVDAKGKVVAVSAGTTKIIITCGDVVKECTVVCDIETESETDPTDPTEPSEPTEPSNPTMPTKPDNTVKKSNKRTIGIVIIASAVVLAAVICVFYMRGDD